MTHLRLRGLLTLLALNCTLLAPTALALPKDSTRVFTDEQPLVYEDAWDLWPYIFLNENGEPAGYNADLLKMIFKRLNIPFTIKLKPVGEAFKDMQEGHSDLMLGMGAKFDGENIHYGETIVQLLTQSVVHHSTLDDVVQNVGDLGKQKVMVHNGSLAHQLMIAHGWGDKAIPFDDMQEAMQKAYSDPNSQLVWNTLSLKWLIRKYHFSDMVLSPIDIPHGEYRFLSGNTRLLHLVDSVYMELRSEDVLQPLQNKWFYPERQDTGIPAWVWKVAGALILIALGFMVYYGVYRLREKRMTKAVRSSNSRLGLILKTSKVRIWLYNVGTRSLTRLNEDGSLKVTSFEHEFASHITPEDYERLAHAVRDVAKQKTENATLNLMTKDEEDNRSRNLSIVLSVLRRNKSGQPTDIIGTASDITEEQERQLKVKDTLLRYQVIFNTAMVDIAFYNSEGVLVDMNQKASSAFAEGKESVLKDHVTIQEVLGMDDFDVEHFDYLYLTQVFRQKDDPRALTRYLNLGDEFYYELQLVPIRDAQGTLLGIFGTGRNVTEIAKSYSQLQQNSLIMQQANEGIQEYINNTDFVLKNGGVRMTNYAPDTHTLTIYSELNKAQYVLTQTRALSLIADESKKMGQRILNSMDNHTMGSINATIKTTLRTQNRAALYLHVSFIPTYDDRGQVNGYFGMARDVSDIKATEAELERETVKAQEVETVKNAFLHNMSYEIRTPLNTVVGFAELFEMEHSPEDEQVFTTEIKENSAYLLKLINDILFLSRLDARMIEFNQKPVDFAAIFEPRCQSAWYSQQKPGVNYIVDNPYHHLVVEIDEQNLGIIIDQLIRFATQRTNQGMVRARYDYTGDQLVMAIQDTGDDIPEEQLAHIFERFTASDNKNTGLGMSICQELISQMGGKINIKSINGKGAIVWVAIPCKVSEIERK